MVQTFFSSADIEAQIREIQEKKKTVQASADGEDQVALGKTGFYDQDIYDGTNNKFDGYVTSIAANDEIEVSTVINDICTFILFNCFTPVLFNMKISF